MRNSIFSALFALGVALLGLKIPSADAAVVRAPSSETWVCYTQTETVDVPQDQELGDYVEAYMELNDGEGFSAKPSSMATVDFSVHWSDAVGFWVDGAAEVYESRYTRTWPAASEFNNIVIAHARVPVTVAVTAAPGSVVEIQRLRFCNN